MGGFIGESLGVRNTFVHELTSVHLPGTSFWENRGGFLTFLLFSFGWPKFSVKTQKYRTFVRYFCCVSLLSTHFGPSGETRTPGILLPNVCRNLQSALYGPLWPFPLLGQFLFNTLLPCLFQETLSSFGICVGLDSVY